MNTDYRNSHLERGKGQSYHDKFLNNPYRKMVWELEKRIIDEILSTFYKDTKIYHLDFACGTGRILNHLVGRVSSSVGVDLSPSMIEVARRNNKTSEIIQADLTRNDVLGERKFNLITAFRFFPNAQQELRIEALHVLKNHVQENGYIVFNNHLHTGNLKYKIIKLLNHKTNKGMSCAEVKSLLNECGLKIVGVYHLCVVPSSEKHLLLPVFLLYKIEHFISRLRLFRKYAENVIYVCCKSD